MASGRIASRVLVVLALVTLVSLPLTAQTVTGTINGTIGDALSVRQVRDLCEMLDRLIEVFA